jgi:hypothetical protein
LQGRVGLVQLVDGVQHAEGGVQRPLRVVLMCGRGAEHRHDGVADELVQGAAEPLDLGPQAQVVGTQHRADVLGVGVVGAGGEPDQVAEQHRDDLAFFTGPPALDGQPATAGPAEPGPLQRGVAAMRTSRHGQSLRGGGPRHRNRLAARRAHPDRGLLTDERRDLGSLAR